MPHFFLYPRVIYDTKAVQSPIISHLMIIKPLKLVLYVLLCVYIQQMYPNVMQDLYLSTFHTICVYVLFRYISLSWLFFFECRVCNIIVTGYEIRTWEWVASQVLYLLKSQVFCIVYKWFSWFSTSWLHVFTLLL